MEFGYNIKKEEMDTDETESDWFGYASKSGEIFFYYNIKTGEHRWPANFSFAEKMILKVRTSDVPQRPTKLCNVATQTEDYGCVNQCSSRYVDNERQMESKESQSNEIREVSINDTIDVTEQNMLNNTVHVDDNVHEVSGDFEMDESLSTMIVTDIKRRNVVVQNVHPQQEYNAISYSCPLCFKKFKQKSYVELHIRTHTGEKPFECSYCDKAFTRKTNLVLHLRTHTGEKPYKCSHCDKAFTQKNNLQTHLRIHTGEKPYECSYCYKTFRGKGTLNVHLRLHTGEKPYECSYCGKAFAWKGDLERHIGKHTGEKPHDCSYCDKAFTTKTELKMHLRIHTGEKPYECSYCDKTFTNKSNLNVHLRVHTGEKPYECSFCDKTFTDKSNLNVHLQTHNSA